MLVARVVDSVVCTVHAPALDRARLIVCELEGSTGVRVAAVDTVSARIGDRVLLGWQAKPGEAWVAVTVGLVNDHPEGEGAGRGEAP